MSTLSMGALLTLSAIIFGSALTMKIQYYQLGENSFFSTLRMSLRDMRLLPAGKTSLSARLAFVVGSTPVWSCPPTSSSYGPFEVEAGSGRTTNRVRNAELSADRFAYSKQTDSLLFRCLGVLYGLGLQFAGTGIIQREGETLTKSLFEKYGGFAAVSKIVLTFYDRVCDSVILADYFAHTDMRTLVDHQTKFIASLMGGPASYTDEAIQRIHADLGIDSASFEEMARILEETLEDFDISDTDVALVMREIRRREKLIVTV